VQICWLVYSQVAGLGSWGVYWFVFCLVEEESGCLILHLLADCVIQSVLLSGCVLGCCLVVVGCTPAE
jgi:hypothetical protein